MIPLSKTGASLGFAIGCALIVIGVFLLFGLAWALIVTGLIVAGSFLLFAPVEEPPPPPPTPDEENRL